METLERLGRTLDGQVPDRVLNFDLMMTFAAHHINRPLSEYYLDYRTLTRANYAVVDDFGIDILQAVSDPYREAADLGSPVEFPHDDLPVLKNHLLSDRARLGDLRVLDPGSGRRMSDRLSAVRDYREQRGGQLPVLGWVEGALAEAADLRGVGALMTDLYDEPAWVEALLELCTEQAIGFATAQIDAGADIIGIGDAIASQISPRMYRKFALPYEQRIIVAIHDKGGLARLHICGDTTKLLPSMAETGADIVDIDWMVPIDVATSTLSETVICGNIDPVAVLLQGSADEVREATIACRQLAGPRFIGMAGCEIPDRTPEANIHAQRQALDSPLVAKDSSV